MRPLLSGSENRLTELLWTAVPGSPALDPNFFVGNSKFPEVYRKNLKESGI
jgi:hypothetical protein